MFGFGLGIGLGRTGHLNSTKNQFANMKSFIYTLIFNISLCNESCTLCIFSIFTIPLLVVGVYISSCFFQWFSKTICILQHKTPNQTVE
ncbi:hypothetical protein Hanom_Chr03g00188551 [Helianthus anomalus]